MKYAMLYSGVYILIFLFIISLFIFNTKIISADSGINKTAIVEVNLIGFSEPPIPEVGIEVPDYIFLGNVTRESLISDEVKVSINNTGKTNITVTPQLKDSSEKIFSYLFFRTRKSSSDPELNKFYKIGSYRLDIEKPSSDKRSEYCYMRLDLTNYPEEIKKDDIGYNAEIVFFAMPK